MKIDRLWCRDKGFAENNAVGYVLGMEHTLYVTESSQHILSREIPFLA